jgi:hypothetical protein
MDAQRGVSFHGSPRSAGGKRRPYDDAAGLPMRGVEACVGRKLQCGTLPELESQRMVNMQLQLWRRYADTKRNMHG